MSDGGNTTAVATAAAAETIAAINGWNNAAKDAAVATTIE